MLQCSLSDLLTLPLYSMLYIAFRRLCSKRRKRPIICPNESSASRAVIGCQILFSFDNLSPNVYLLGLYGLPGLSNFLHLGHINAPPKRQAQNNIAATLHRQGHKNKTTHTNSLQPHIVTRSLICQCYQPHSAINLKSASHKTRQTEAPDRQVHTYLSHSWLNNCHSCKPYAVHAAAAQKAIFSPVFLPVPQ